MIYLDRVHLLLSPHRVWHRVCLILSILLLACNPRVAGLVEVNQRHWHTLLAIFIRFCLWWLLTLSSL
jgi:hypothetical protein